MSNDARDAEDEAAFEKFLQAVADADDNFIGAVLVAGVSMLRGVRESLPETLRDEFDMLVLDRLDAEGAVEEPAVATETVQ